MSNGIAAPAARTLAAEHVNSSEASQRFAAIIADADDGVLIIEPGGMIAYANDAADFLLGQGRSELYGELFGLPLSPGDQTVSVNVIAKDSSLRLVEMRVEALADEGTRVVRIRDVTNYHQRVEQAQNEVRQRDEFLAMLSHELRNPLAAIRSGASLLALDGLSAAERAEADAVIDRQFQHLSRILDDLLDVTRILRGKLVLSPSRVDLNQLLRDAVAAVKPLMDRNRQTFHCEISDHRVWVWGDGTRLEQIVVNLLNNAAKFTPAKGTISLSASAEGKSVTICVRDDGPGIPPELMPHIFEAFVQGRQALDRTDGGLGIGLMLVRKFTDLHGGTVTVERNADGKGACFQVSLPLLELESEPEAGCELQRENGPLRVLLVEDCSDVRQMLKRLLHSDGFEVLEAASGTEGLELLLNEPLDVALVDIGLPGLNGYEVARQLRQKGQGTLPRMIAVTGYGRPEDVQAARQAGFDDHLVKPVQMRELRKILGKIRDDVGASSGG